MSAGATIVPSPQVSPDIPAIVPQQSQTALQLHQLQLQLQQQQLQLQLQLQQQSQRSPSHSPSSQSMQAATQPFSPQTMAAAAPHMQQPTMFPFPMSNPNMVGGDQMFPFMWRPPGTMAMSPFPTMGYGMPQGPVAQVANGQQHLLLQQQQQQQQQQFLQFQQMQQHQQQLMASSATPQGPYQYLSFSQASPQGQTPSAFPTMPGFFPQGPGAHQPLIMSLPFMAQPSGSSQPQSAPASVTASSVTSSALSPASSPVLSQQLPKQLPQAPTSSSSAADCGSRMTPKKRQAPKRSAAPAAPAAPEVSASSSQDDAHSTGSESVPMPVKKGRGQNRRAKPKTVKPRPRSKALVSNGWDSMTYAEMIRQAILSTPDRKMLLCDIYAYLEANFDCFSKNGESWKNSVRHNLSIHKQFKVEPIDSEREAQLLLDGKIKKGSAGLWTLNCTEPVHNSAGDHAEVRHTKTPTSPTKVIVDLPPLPSSAPSSPAKRSASPSTDSRSARPESAASLPPAKKAAIHEERSEKEDEEDDLEGRLVMAEEEEEEEEEEVEEEGDEEEGSQLDSDESAESETANILLHLSK